MTPMMISEIAVRRFFGKAVLCLFLAVALDFYPGSARADSLRDALNDLVKVHKLIKAADLDTAAAKERIRVARGNWYPTLGMTANLGYEEQRKGQGVEDTNIHPKEVGLNVAQTLWDFGSNNAVIDSAVLTHEQKKYIEDVTRQALILEGINAHLALTTALKVLEYARQSEASLKKQTEIEDALVKRGSGMAMNKLQAVRELDGAIATRVEREGGLKIALNRYRAVFEKVPANLETLVNPRIPTELIPETLDQAIETALRNNPELVATQLTSELARENVKKTFADEIFPTLKASVDAKWKNDIGGTAGSKQEYLYKVELKRSFNMGLTAINTLRASEQTQMSSENTYGDARTRIEEKVRSAWDMLVTIKEVVANKENEANIASEFLVLSRKDLQLGNTDLINVLQGEKALINALIAAEDFRTGVSVQAFTLLNAMGMLEADVIDN